MSTSHPLHQFADATSAQVRDLGREDCRLIIRQKPEHAKVAIGKEKDRKPIDPPPIVQLKIINNRDPSQAFLQSPYFFMSVNLLKGGEMQQGSGSSTNMNTSLAGTLVSSLHRLKDIDNSDGGFFVFADLSVKLEGIYMEVHHLTSTISDEFKVDIAKNWPGMAESTQLTRSFSDQGVKLRLRKEPRTLLRKRGPASDDYEPMRYRSKGGRHDDTSGQGAGRTDSPIATESQQRTENSYRSSLREGNAPSLSQRSETSNPSGPTKFDLPTSPHGTEMAVPFQSRLSISNSSLSSAQAESIAHNLSAANRIEEFGGNTSRRGSTIAQLRQSSSGSALNSPSQGQPISSGPLIGGPGNQYLPPNATMPPSNRTSFSEYSGAYTHQSPTLTRQQTPQSQAFPKNYPQHNYSRSQNSLTSQSPTTTRSTPHSYYGFSAGPRDAFTGLPGSTLTSPFESPDVDRREEFTVWPGEGGDDRSSLALRRQDPLSQSGVLYSTPTPHYGGPRPAMTSAPTRQPGRASHTISPTQLHGLGLSGGPFAPSAAYMPPPNLMPSVSGLMPSLPGAMHAPSSGSEQQQQQQERMSRAPDAASLSSTIGAGSLL